MAISLDRQNRIMRSSSLLCSSSLPCRAGRYQLCQRKPDSNVVLLKCSAKIFAVHPAVLAFELEGRRVEDVAETERVSLLLHLNLCTTDRLALGINDLHLQRRLADSLDPCACLLPPRSIRVAASVGGRRVLCMGDCGKRHNRGIENPVVHLHDLQSELLGKSFRSGQGWNVRCGKVLTALRFEGLPERRFVSSGLVMLGSVAVYWSQHVEAN